MASKKVLVVATTTDYVGIIRRRFPQRALFLTDKKLRSEAVEERPADSEEVLVDLDDQNRVFSDLKSHLSRFDYELSGIACFDDESLMLASRIATRYSLPFHDEKSIWTSRSKFHSKRAWIQEGIPCPRVLTARDRDALETVMDKLGFPLVLKPMTGSGSELVFWCPKRDRARAAFNIIHKRLQDHPDGRMYQPWTDRRLGLDPTQDIVAEEGLTGPEFSCDFLMTNGRAKIIRTAGKVLAPEMGTGTTLIYYIPANGATGIGQTSFEQQLSRAAEALGFEQGLFMADFIIYRGKAYFLELSPRPSGDCVPWLIKASSGLDVIGLTLDVAEGRKVTLPDISAYTPLAALRLFSRKAGTLEDLDSSLLTSDPRVMEVSFYRRPGHRILLPPGDYFSRIIGHVIFRTGNIMDLEEEGAHLEQLARIKISA